MPELSPYQIILLFVVGGLIGVAAPLVIGKLIRPNRPNEEKNTTYECGEDPTGSAWGKFNIRFYVIALVFILFETELVFLFPWAIVFGDKTLIEATDGVWGKFAFVEMSIFILILVLGLAYVWAKGFLEWDRPELNVKKFDSKVPNDLYTQVNEKYS
ncbi:MAG: NADH-quinone oxidoreductase subunit A [Cyclobacteriaceae bacterium]